jgi:hypothetical protein
MNKAHFEVVRFESGGVSLDVNISPQEDTVWLSQEQIALLFSKERTVITKHIKSIIEQGEIEEKSNVQKMHFAHSDRPVSLYSLDVVLAVGYRVNSKQGILFRKLGFPFRASFFLFTHEI